MSDQHSREGNGAVVAIVMVLGIVVLGGLVSIGAAFIYFMQVSPPVQVTVAASTPVPAPVATKVAATPAAPATPLPVQLPIEVNSADQLLVNGDEQSLDDFKQLLNDIKNGNSPFTEVIIRFAGSSEARMEELVLVLKEVSITYEVDPTGKVPAAPE
jgi:hypothetical protein